MLKKLAAIRICVSEDCVRGIACLGILWNLRSAAAADEAYVASRLVACSRRWFQLDVVTNRPRRAMQFKNGDLFL